ncbi:hypothetical protein PAECIP111893_00642 [Paenibacillus plantiphilus]|uniref:Uncharacterized protein n=1 Tax=Paenibacillus plantiphilus TaxID=2905650 RepID=A0ABN8G610_9BACL|nr:hypothetical protein PAECIP111893_00642 [Paenibacillus plantiphilus]
MRVKLVNSVLVMVLLFTLGSSSILQARSANPEFKEEYGEVFKNTIDKSYYFYR